MISDRKMSFIVAVAACALAVGGIVALSVAASERVNAQIATPGQPLVPLGYCQLTSLSASTGLSSCSGGIPATANAVVLRAEAQALRYRDDLVAPSATVGMPMAVADAAIFYQGRIGNLRFIEQTSGGKLDVSFYKGP